MEKENKNLGTERWENIDTLYINKYNNNNNNNNNNNKKSSCGDV